MFLTAPPPPRLVSSAYLLVSRIYLCNDGWGGAHCVVSNGNGIGKDVERTGRLLCVKGVRKIITLLRIASFQPKF
jgi:hypothetical protein